VNCLDVGWFNLRINPSLGEHFRDDVADLKTLLDIVPGKVRLIAAQNIDIARHDLHGSARLRRQRRAVQPTPKWWARGDLDTSLVVILSNLIEQGHISSE
jgi:hypothetical protein